MTPQAFFNSEKSRLIDEMKQLLRIRSISTREENRPDIQKAADWVQKKLASIGLENTQQLVINDGNPVVVAQKIFDPKLPTLLVYGHYDVQPPEPLEEWVSDPFEPVERDGALYGRGTTDNKAQFMTNIAALEYYLQHVDKKNWNIKVAIEGEEEVGGPSIDKMITMSEYEQHFKSDYAYISDGPWVKSDVPSIEFTLRGLVYFDLELQVSSSDMHSGLFGNVVMNPANLAGYVIYKLKDILANRLRIPNVYKQMRKLSKEESDSITASSMTWEETKANSGSTVVTPYKRHGENLAPGILTGTRPSLDVHGILAGFTEKGRLKTVIPATALVKFSLRLVPFMDPDHTVQLVEKYIKKIMPKGVSYTLTCLSKGKPYITDPNDIQIDNLRLAFKDGFGKLPHLTTCGGSIGLVTKLAEMYGIKSLLASYGLPDDHLHGPNEKFNISQIEGGFKTLVSFLVD